MVAFAQRTFCSPVKREEHSQEYRDALKSDHWKGIRKLAHARSKGVCESCHKYPATSTHHKHYDTLGHERLEDVLDLCNICHILAEQQRKEERTERVQEARLSGWATKVYGPNWMNRPGRATAELAFHAWLKKKGYKE